VTELSILFVVALVPLGLALLGFWIWMLIDCLRAESVEPGDRLPLVLVVVL